MAETKFTDDKRRFSSGAVRNSDKGKPRYGLIPPQALKRVAMRYTQGAEHYGDNNWEKGMPIKDFVDSAMRHFEQWRAGYRDEDHLAAVVWNILAIIYFEEVGRDEELGPVLFQEKPASEVTEAAIPAGEITLKGGSGRIEIRPADKWNDSFTLR